MFAVLLHLKTRIKKIKKKIKGRIKLLKKDIYVSLGENCLADDILARNNLKSFSSPYASARSNIEYIIDFENENFSDFLNFNYLKYDSTGEKKVVRNNKYLSVENQYASWCTNGFEFTHHDVIKRKDIRKTFKRRCKRMRNLKNKNITMLYHHRRCEETDKNLLIQHLLQLSKIYEKRNNKVNIYLFSQIIVPNEKMRKVEHYEFENIHIYDFYTLWEWRGGNEDILWARCDDDLLKFMIDDIKKQRLSHK